jgi:hypothetical protein
MDIDEGLRSDLLDERSLDAAFLMRPFWPGSPSGSEGYQHKAIGGGGRLPGT